MANLVFPGGAGITTVVNTDLESDDMTFLGTSIAGAAQQTDYSDIKAGIIGNPGALGGVTPAANIKVKGTISLQQSDYTGRIITDGYDADSGVLSGASVVLDFGVNSDEIILAVQLQVIVAVTTGGANLWNAAYSGGITQNIVTGAAASKNTNIAVFFDANANTAIAPSEVNVTLTPDSGTFTGGQILGIVWYQYMADFTNV